MSMRASNDPGFVVANAASAFHNSQRPECVRLMTFSRLKIHLAGPVLTLWLVACASTPVPTGDVDRSSMLVQGALAAEAEIYAPVELQFAQDRVAQAREALAAGNNKLAARLAAQAEADAELAMARARVARLRAAADAQAAENAKLRAELLGETP